MCVLYHYKFILSKRKDVKTYQYIIGIINRVFCKEGILWPANFCGRRRHFCVKSERTNCWFIIQMNLKLGAYL